MKILITGGCGFLGSNLAAFAIERGDELIIFDNLYRHGSIQNLIWLKTMGIFEFNHGDIRNREDVDRTVKNTQPDVIFHLAGQVAMTTSIENPRIDFEVNAQGSLNILESVRRYAPNATVIYSSTNKVYGDLEWTSYEELETRYVATKFPNGFPENILLEFHSPYGCSKGTADQYMLDYARIYGLNTVVFRHSSMYGGRQYATYDQGWIGWFCQQAIAIKEGRLKAPFNISGNGKQVRDLLYVSDTVSLYINAVEKIDTIKGQAFNVGGGMRNALSLLELFIFLERELDIRITYTKLPPRESDQRVFVADLAKVKDLIKWEPRIDKEEGIRKMIGWVSGECKKYL